MYPTSFPLSVHKPRLLYVIPMLPHKTQTVNHPPTSEGKNPNKGVQWSREGLKTIQMAANQTKVAHSLQFEIRLAIDGWSPLFSLVVRGLPNF